MRALFWVFRAEFIILVKLAPIFTGKIEISKQQLIKLIEVEILYLINLKNKDFS